MARTFYSDCLAELRPLVGRMETIESMDGGTYLGAYLGSFMSLDPCGRYHHCLSPNGVTGRCESFWEALERAADKLGGWIESGEGDPTDIFFCLPADSCEEPDKDERPIGCDHASYDVDSLPTLTHEEN